MRATCYSLVCLALGPVLVSCSSQWPFTDGYYSDKDSSQYHFKRPIRNVAVIGAGVGGLLAHKELKELGFEVHSYERDHAPGGNWHYSDEAPPDAPVPNADPSIGDYEPSLPPNGVKIPYSEEFSDAEQNNLRRRTHRAPKPVWKTLKSNAPAPIQQIRELRWPHGTPWVLPNQQLQRYLRAFASWLGVNANDENTNISYNTRVELVEKHISDEGDEVGWTLTLKELENTHSGNLKATWYKKNYDAVVIATGRYNAPNVPNIDGLQAWSKQFPRNIIHSRQYRIPEPFANQTILVVGAAISASEIAREVIQSAKIVYQSVRPDNSPIPTIPGHLLLRRQPRNITILPEIRRFRPPSHEFNRGEIELANGTIITGVDHIIFGTGYRYSYPFLPQFHNSSLGLNDHASPNSVQPIVTDGSHLRSLYLDTFYIPNPTLAFINMNVGMQSFVYGEFLSSAIAKVWSGTAELPSTSALWRWYEKEWKRRKGYGKHFQFLGADRTRENLRFFQGWLNEAAVKFGGKQINGLPEDTTEISALWIKAQFGDLDIGVDKPANRSGGHQVLGLNFDQEFKNTVRDTVQIQGTESWAQDFLYNDYW